MSKKKDSKNTRNVQGELAEDELLELQMILDRLAVQSPGGGSLANYIQSLRTALKGRDRMIAVLVERLGSRPSQVGFRTLMGLQDLVDDKRARKLVKQVIYRFEQKGFVVPREEPSGQPVVLVQSEVREPLAHVAPTRESFWFLSVILHEPGSLEPLAISAFPEGSFDRLGVKAARTSYRLYREYVHSISDSLSNTLREVPVWHVARLFRELLEFCSTAEPSADVERVKRALRSYDDPQRLPYAYELMMPLERPPGQLPKTDVNRLLEQVAFSWLAFSKEDLLPYWQRAQEVDSSPLVLANNIQDQRVDDIMRGALDDLCTGKVRFRWQRFFEEYALWFKLSGNDELAEWSWWVARNLAEGERVSDDPVAFAMLGIFVDAHWGEETLKAGNSKGPYCETDSGLIVPC